MLYSNYGIVETIILSLFGIFAEYVPNANLKLEIVIEPQPGDLKIFYD